mmetsp:Transcript_90434/g.281555  ORF Transcript_90434/g.281555 Transcript_90434/m.281555 type:complete len:219 (+) Transcript_90434:83-739(+)
MSRPCAQPPALIKGISYARAERTSHTATCPSSADMEKRPAAALSKLHDVIAPLNQPGAAAAALGEPPPPAPPAPAPAPRDPEVLPRKRFRAELKAAEPRSAIGVPTSASGASTPQTSHPPSPLRKSTGAQSKPQPTRHLSVMKAPCKRGRPLHLITEAAFPGPPTRSFTLTVASCPKKARNCPLGLNATELTHEPASSETSTFPNPLFSGFIRFSLTS